MKSCTKGITTVARVFLAAALSFFLYTSTLAAQVMYMRGNIAGNLNGTAVDFDLDIRLDMATGEEAAAVGRMDPAMGAILRQVIAMVTVGGPTGGATPHGGQNLFELSGGNFVNSASVYWPKTGDQLELIHNVSYSGGDTMQVSATINGTVPVISGGDEVTYADFSEIMYWGDGQSEQVVTTGVGFRGDFSSAQFRSYNVGGNPSQNGKGATTTYWGPGPSRSPVLRSARDITTTYNPATRTMNVHLYNTLTPVESAP